MLKLIIKKLYSLFEYLRNDPFYIFKYFYFYFQKDFKVKANFISSEDLANDIKNGKSFIRLGDGEISLIHGRSIWYENYKKEIKLNLLKIIKGFNKNSKYILAIPKFVNDKNIDLKDQNLLRCWLPLKMEFQNIFNKDLFYANAHAFYIKSFFDKDLNNYFKTKKIIVLTTKKNKEKIKNDFEKDFDCIGWVEAKEPNPFDWYQKNKNEILNILDKDKILNQNRLKSDIIILISAGPAGKILAYEFSNLDYQAIDIGHGIEQLYDNKKYLEKEFFIKR